MFRVITYAVTKYAKPGLLYGGLSSESPGEL